MSQSVAETEAKAWLEKNGRQWGGILPDWLIKQYVKIEPFVDKSPPNVISYGLGHYGYDMRVGYKFKVFTNVYGAVVDPKNLKPQAFVDVDLSPTLHSWNRPDQYESPRYWYCYKCGTATHTSEDTPVGRDPGQDGKCTPVEDHILIPPNSFALAESVEWFDIPRDVLAIVLGKSTYARCGIICNVTPLEPEWHGKVTVEISNTTPLPVKIYANEGIAQVLFIKCPQVIECKVSYADKKGIYQGQGGLTLPTVRRE